MAKKIQYETKTCSSCDGKGTVKSRIETPGKFAVTLAVKASFLLEWNDAGDSTAKQVEKDLRFDIAQLLRRPDFAKFIDYEVNTVPMRLKHEATVAVKKLA
jgi:hypothetical protein